MDEQIEGVFEALSDISEDSTIPKNLKEKLKVVMEALSKEGELSLKIDKALHELGEISEDNNLQPYTRTQIWNIVSMLEMTK